MSVYLFIKLAILYCGNSQTKETCINDKMICAEKEWSLLGRQYYPEVKKCFKK